MLAIILFAVAFIVGALLVSGTKTLMLKAKTEEQESVARNAVFVTTGYLVLVLVVSFFLFTVTSLAFSVTLFSVFGLIGLFNIVKENAGESLKQRLFMGNI